MVRPEDYGGATDPLADFANTSTKPGTGAGRAIDPTRPSLEQPGPTADRIAELRRDIAEMEEADAPAHMIDSARAELARLYNGSKTDHIAELERELAEITAASKAALLGDIPADINRVRRAAEIVPELSRLRSAPSPATSPGPQDVREALASLIGRSYYEHRPLTDTRTLWQHIADALLSAFPARAQSDAQPVIATVEQKRGRLDTNYSDSPVETWYQLSVAGQKFALWSQHDAERLAELFNTRVATPPALPEGAREALEAERQAIATEARRYASHYPQGSDGRNTFILLAEWIEARRATLTYSSAGLIEAADAYADAGSMARRMADNIEGQFGNDLLMSGLRDLGNQLDAKAKALRARAADRSAT